MLTTDAHTAALNWATRALSEELPDEEIGTLATRAEILTAIAAAEGIPIGVLLEWIHTRVAGKSWSSDEWRSFSAKCRSKSVSG